MKFPKLQWIDLLLIPCVSISIASIGWTVEAIRLMLEGPWWVIFALPLMLLIPFYVNFMIYSFWEMLRD